MKLNGLTNNLKGNDQSLSNSYLQRIVELLRQEVQALTSKENDLESILTEHIETQKSKVDTQTVNASKINTSNINDIIILSEAINMLTTLKVNGKEVLTEGVFQGPFSYKGVVDVLPTTADPGDVYIYNNVVYVSDGTGYDSFDIPLGTISRVEYENDKNEMLLEIFNIQANERILREGVDRLQTTVDNQGTTLGEIQTELDNKVDLNPVDNKTYVRKNNEWVEQYVGSNYVPRVVEESTIDNTEQGVSITSPKVDINADLYIKDKTVNEVVFDKNQVENQISIELKKGPGYLVDAKTLYFKRSPFDASSSIRKSHYGYSTNFWRESCTSPATKYSIFTKDYQYVKVCPSGGGDSNLTVQILSIDKNGTVRPIENPWIDDASSLMQSSCFMSLNPEYVEDNTVYLIHPKDQGFDLIQYTDGKLKDVYFHNIPLVQSLNDTSRHLGITAGKALRSSSIQRILVLNQDTTTVANKGIILGGNLNEDTTLPFDPTKSINIQPNLGAYFATACCAATDSAWYLMQNNTGKITRVSPDGSVAELLLPANVTACAGNYIEYTDKNGRPAVAFYVQNIASNGSHYVVFLEEGESSEVQMTVRTLTSSTYTPVGNQLYSQQFRFIENSHNIFFVADCGQALNGTTNFGHVSMKIIIWHWDKESLTTASKVINVGGFDLHSFLEVYKTKNNAIWITKMIQDQVPNNELNYIEDTPNVQIQSIALSDRNTSYFRAHTNASISSLYYTHLINNGTWDNAGIRNSLAAVNGDGILMVMSGDLKSFTLCYGNGVVKQYFEDKIPFKPDLTVTGSVSYGYPTLIGTKHGWLLSTRCPDTNFSGSIGWDLGGLNIAQDTSYTYFGIQYVDEKPDINKMPKMTKFLRNASDRCKQMDKYETFGYLQTYDDYERRNKVLWNPKFVISHNVSNLGCDAYWHEVGQNDIKDVTPIYFSKPDNYVVGVGMSLAELKKALNSIEVL